MTRSEILEICHAEIGDMNKAAIKYGKQYGLPAKSVLTSWKVVLDRSTNKPAPKAQRN